MKHTLLLLLLLPVAAIAQQRDFATEYSATYGFKPWRGGGITLGEKVRLTENSSRYSQSKTSFVVQQSLFRRQLALYDMRLRIGTGYTFVNRLNTGSQYYYENQHRLMLQTTLSHDHGFWRFAGRVRMQSTFRDETRGDYRYNPKLMLRGRLSASYSLPDKPWKFEANAEYFYRLNDPRGAFVDEMRYTASATHIVDRHQSVSIYLKYFHEMQVSDPLRMLAVGLRYDFE